MVNRHSRGENYFRACMASCIKFVVSLAITTILVWATFYGFFLSVTQQRLYMAYFILIITPINVYNVMRIWRSTRGVFRSNFYQNIEK